MENQHTDDLSRILRTVEEILEIVHFMKDHRSQLEGDPILDFAEVCQLLRQSERQVRRFREQGLLVGFTIGARRMYLLSEVQEFIRKMRRRGKLESFESINPLPMETKQNPRIYRLVPSEQLERLIKTNFLLSKGLLLFEYLCSQSDEPALPDGRCGLRSPRYSSRDADPLPSKTTDSPQDLSAAVFPRFGCLTV